MRTRLGRLLLIPALSALPSTATAQPGVPERGDIGLFFDAAGSQITATAEAFTPFELYLITFGPGQVSAWEAGYFTSGPFSVIEEHYSEAGVLDFGSTGNHIVGLGGCYDYSVPTALLRILGGYFVADPGEQLICLYPTQPSSFGGREIGYVDCADQLHPFGVAVRGGWGYPNACAVLNPADEYGGIPVRPSSIGAFKTGS